MPPPSSQRDYPSVSAFACPSDRHLHGRGVATPALAPTTQRYATRNPLFATGRAIACNSAAPQSFKVGCTHPFHFLPFSLFISIRTPARRARLCPTALSPSLPVPRSCLPRQSSSRSFPYLPVGPLGPLVSLSVWSGRHARSVQARSAAFCIDSGVWTGNLAQPPHATWGHSDGAGGRDENDETTMPELNLE